MFTDISNLFPAGCHKDISWSRNCGSSG